MDDRYPGVFIPRLNKIQMRPPDVPFISQWQEVPQDLICNAEDRKCPDTTRHCECFHVVKVPLNALVELVLVDTGDEPSEDSEENPSEPPGVPPPTNVHHPFHLHGYHFHVVAQQQTFRNATPEQIFRLVERGVIPLNLYRAPLKDTVGIPINGFVVLRFVANNPGPGFFHCHIGNHAVFSFHFHSLLHF